MANAFFRFKQFTVHQERCAMKVTTDACLFGAWVASKRKTFVGQHHRSLDIGTGTGLLSLMVAQKAGGRITAVEIDGDATREAAENVAASPWADRIEVIEQDMLTWKDGQVFDCIFSNPPFYENELQSPAKAKNVAHHSTALPLAGLLAVIKARLKKDGEFFLLLPAKRYSEIDRLAGKAGLSIQQTVFVRQTPSHEVFRVLLQGRGDVSHPLPNEELVIKQDATTYSPAFRALLNDYYLYL